MVPLMSMIFDYDCTTTDGELTIDGVAMHTPAWTVLDPAVLWQPALQRGDDLLVPGMPGVLALPRRVSVTSYTLRTVIRGTHDRNGTPYSNSSYGLWANIEFLRQHVVDPSPYNMATLREAELTIPGSAVTMQGDVHVDSLELGDRVGPFFRASLTLTIPAGRLEVVEP